MISALLCRFRFPDSCGRLLLPNVSTAPHSTVKKLEISHCNSSEYINAAFVNVFELDRLKMAENGPIVRSPPHSQEHSTILLGAQKRVVNRNPQ